MSGDQAEKKRKSVSKAETDDGSKKQKQTTPKKHSSTTPEVKSVQKLHIPGFDEIKDGVVWKDGVLDFEASVQRMAGFVAKYVKHTPQYYYELLSQIFNCKLHLKLENLQMFGDIYVRNCFGIILGNYFNQKPSIKKEFYEVTGLVIVMNPQEPSDHHLLDGIALTGLHLKFDCIIYVAPGNLSLLQCVQLHSCHQKGAKVIFHKGDTASCLVRASKHADDMRMIYIDHKHSPQYAMLGAATVAYEMLHEETPLDTIVMPLRLFSVGWSYVAGISFYAKMIKPTIRVIVVQMNEDMARAESKSQNQAEAEKENKQPLFPDRTETGWLSLVQESSVLRNVFDAFDARNLGKFSVLDLENIIVSMGGDSKRFPPQLQTPLSLTEFMKLMDKERMKMLGSMLDEHKKFIEFLSLDNLKAKNMIDDVVVVSEDQAVQSFIKCLEYTHTLTNGKGSIALAGLFSGKIQVKKDENLAVLIMGGFVDVIDFQTLFNYGLDLIGQNFEVELDLQDNATALSSVLKLIGDMKVSVYEILMDRTGEALKQYHVRTRIQCRSRNFEQQQEKEDMGFRGKSTRNPMVSPKMSGAHQASSVFLSVDHYSSSRASLPPSGSSSSQNSSISNNNNNNNASNNGKKHGNDKKADSSPASPAPERRMENVTIETVLKAHERIKNNLNHTPIYLSQIYSKLCKCKLYLMLENIQKTGSFKIRGSSNMVLKALETSSTPPKGLVAASAGNHAQGVALVSNKVGLPCVIVCPEYAPESKLQWTRNYGAEVIKHGNSLEAAFKHAEKICEERDWMMVRPYNDVDVIEGQGTMGCEIYEQIPDIDTVVVNVGGGGMIAGIALYLKAVNPNIRIVGVQSANVAPLADFKTTNVLRYIDPTMLTIADGTNVKLPGGVHTKVLAELVDEYVTVSENEIASTIVHLMENSRTLSEGAGCLGLAALLHHKITVRKDEKVCVVICGGNIDMSTLRQVYEYGLISLGRLFTIHVSTWDYPGNLAKIIALAAKAELVVREIRHIRGKGDVNWNEVTISLAFYSNSFHHQQLFLNLLVEENLFPKVIGRRYIKEHETIYASVDKAVELKKAEMQKKHNEHSEQFMTWYRQQFAAV